MVAHGVSHGEAGAKKDVEPCKGGSPLALCALGLRPGRLLPPRWGYHEEDRLFPRLAPWASFCRPCRG